MLKLTVDSIDAVDEPLRDLYEEVDGKYRLKVEGVEDTAPLRKALENSRRVEKELEKKVKRWEALGKSDEEIAALLKASEEKEQSEAERKGEWDKLRAQMNEKHQLELKSKDDVVGKMRTTLERYLVDAQATAAIAAAKGEPELLLPHVQRHVKVIEEDGEFVSRVVDAKGDPRVNSKGEPLSIEELVAEMRQSDKFSRAFDGSGASGSGMPPGNGAGGAGAKTKSDFKTEKERAEFVQKNGMAAYNALPA